MGFYMGDARIKATTLHSFKGCEFGAMVIFIGQSVEKKAHRRKLFDSCVMYTRVN